MLRLIWTPKTFFEVLEPEKGPGGGGWGWKCQVKNRFFTHMDRFAQGMQNVILHIYFIINTYSLIVIAENAGVAD